MVLNGKKGQAMLVYIMIAMIVFITVVILTEPFTDFIDLARDADHLDCSNAAITTGTKLTCLVVDLSLFFFVGMALAAAFGLVFYHRRKTD